MSQINNTAEQTIESLDPITFGREIFEAIKNEQPGSFDKKYWSGRIMEWSMQYPDFKLNMFRLVDVLPVLQSSAAIQSHVNEYLGPLGAKFGGQLGGLIDWGLNIDPNSLLAKATSFAVKKSVSQMASQFIAGESPKDALSNLKRLRSSGIAFTLDLLGEFAVSEVECLEYLKRYLDLLDFLAQHFSTQKPLIAGHPAEKSAICISVKLTALYSQCSSLNMKRSVDVLSERLSQIARKARKIGATLYVDAEDSGNNELIYTCFKQVFGSSEFQDFPYPGIVLQAYSKDSEARLLDLLNFANTRANPIAIRLVKGAYWDHETTLCAQNEWPSPLFSSKQSSDANYEKLSRILIDHHTLALPAFASHNVRSLSHAVCYAHSAGLTRTDFEIQMLYGMADPISQAFVKRGYLVRQYVPLGDMLVGMGYLVRRLLENTSNESFLRHTFFEHDQVDSLLKAPQFSEPNFKEPNLNG